MYYPLLKTKTSLNSKIDNPENKKLALQSNENMIYFDPSQIPFSSGPMLTEFYKLVDKKRKNLLTIENQSNNKNYVVFKNQHLINEYNKGVKEEFDD